MLNETKLLYLCSSVNLDDVKARSLNEVLNDSLDWEYILKCATQNRVFPLLYKNLMVHCPNRVPLSVLRHLKTLYIANTGRNLQFSALLFKVVDLLEKHNIDVIVFKGLAISGDIYGDISLRAFNDIDLIVPENDLHKAMDLILNEGFSTHINVCQNQYKKLVAKNHHAVLVRERSVIELHWELSGRYLPKSIRFEDIADSTELIELEGRSIQTLGSESLLIYLCVHGSRHFWSDLDSICCVNELIRKKTELSWERVLKAAHDQGAKKMLLLGVHLAQNIFNVRLPEIVEHEISLYPELKIVTEWILNRMQNKSVKHAEPGYWEFLKYHYLVMDKKEDWVRYMFRRIIIPKDIDRVWIKLPKTFSFLHYLTRPVRLIISSRQIKKT